MGSGFVILSLKENLKLQVKALAFHLLFMNEKLMLNNNKTQSTIENPYFTSLQKY